MNIKPIIGANNIFGHQSTNAMLESAITTPRDNPWTVLHTFNWPFALHIRLFFKYYFNYVSRRFFFFLLAVVDTTATVAFVVAGVSFFFYCDVVIPFIRFAVYLFSIFFLYSCFYVTRTKLETILYTLAITDFHVVCSEKKFCHKSMYTHLQTNIDKLIHANTTYESIAIQIVFVFFASMLCVSKSMVSVLWKCHAEKCMVMPMR